METIEMTTIENNKMIAEFMGYIDNGCSEDGFLIHPTTNYDIEIEGLNYHSDWNWIMPVVETIEKTNYGTIEIKSKNLVLLSYNRETYEYYSSSLLINTYEAVIDFIKWYNLNNQNHGK